MSVDRIVNGVNFTAHLTGISDIGCGVKKISQGEYKDGAKKITKGTLCMAVTCTIALVAFNTLASWNSVRGADGTPKLIFGYPMDKNNESLYANSSGHMSLSAIGKCITDKFPRPDKPNQMPIGDIEMNEFIKHCIMTLQ